MKAWLFRHLPDGPWSDVVRIIATTVLVVVLIWSLRANLTTEGKTDSLLKEYHAQTLKSDKITTQRTAQLDAIATSLNTTLELVAVVQEELEAFFPGKTLKVTCGLSKASDLECKVTKTPKENR